MVASLGVAVPMLIGYATQPATPDPVELALAGADRPSPRWFRTIPDRERPLTAAERLEQRLAALAAALERRPRVFGGLIEFDVEGLNDAIGSILAAVADQAEVSVHVRDIETQHVLFDYYGDAALNPASNQKLLTSSAAIDLLGSDYTFHTRILRRGSELYIVGEGDPLLTFEDLHGMAEELAATVKLAEIERLIADDSAFSQRRLGPGYSPRGPGWPYEAPSGAFSLNFNTVEVTVRGVGRHAVVSIAPESDHILVRSRARIGRRKPLRVTSRPHGERTLIELAGQIPAGHTVTVRRRVDEPTRYAARTFAHLVAKIAATEPLAVEIGRAPADAEPVLVHESPPLVEVVHAGLAYSNNFIAEQVLRTLAWRMTGDPGDWDNGIEVLRGYWSALGNNPTAIVIENASGLGTSGRVSTSSLVDLISVAHRVHESSTGLLDLLPVAGQPGTMRTRLRVSGKRVRAKTGTLDGVSGLTGVVTRENGVPQLAFSVLINVRQNHALRAEIRREIADRVVLAVLSYLDDYESRRGGLAPVSEDVAG